VEVHPPGSKLLEQAVAAWKGGIAVDDQLVPDHGVRLRQPQTVPPSRDAPPDGEPGHDCAETEGPSWWFHQRTAEENDERKHRRERLFDLGEF